ncbi:MAG: aminotransferase class IV, partial [Planctomycetes bacterium]|nr:aminotransferase class IV [Planctomycetota bacterium]
TGDVLETAVGNVFFELDGELTTPRLDGRVLPGIARAWLLERASVVERRVSVDEIDRATACLVTNAVHGPRPAELSGFSAPASGSLADRWRREWETLISA